MSGAITSTTCSENDLATDLVNHRPISFADHNANAIVTAVAAATITASKIPPSVVFIVTHPQITT